MFIQPRLSKFTLSQSLERFYLGICLEIDKKTESNVYKSLRVYMIIFTMHSIELFLLNKRGRFKGLKWRSYSLTLEVLHTSSMKTKLSLKVCYCHKMLEQILCVRSLRELHIKMNWRLKVKNTNNIHKPFK